MREVLTHEHTALIVPCGNPSAIAEAVLRMLGDSEFEKYTWGQC